jgi:hypothetical protein
VFVAVSTPVAIAYAVGIWLLILTPGAITWLKGRPDLVGAGLVVGGLVWMVTMWRSAKPTSWWARRFYGPEKLERARMRYAA